MPFSLSPRTCIMSLLFLFTILFLVLQLPFGNNLNQLKHNNNASASIVISKNATDIFHSTSDPLIFDNGSLYSISAMDDINKNESLFTIDQQILQDKILNLFDKYPILIAYTTMLDYLEKFEEKVGYLQADKIKRINELGKQLKLNIKLEENKTTYNNFYNDIINQYAEITTFINDNKIHFTNMEGFYILYLELIFYKNCLVEFKTISKPSTNYKKMVRLSILNAQAEILKELIQSNMLLTSSNLMMMVNSLIPNVLPVLVKAQILTEEIKNDILNLYFYINFNIEDPNHPNDFMALKLEEKLSAIENYKKKTAEIINKN